MNAWPTVEILHDPESIMSTHSLFHPCPWHKAWLTFSVVCGCWSKFVKCSTTPQSTSFWLLGCPAWSNKLWITANGSEIVNRKGIPSCAGMLSRRVEVCNPLKQRSVSLSNRLFLSRRLARQNRAHVHMHMRSHAYSSTFSRGTHRWGFLRQSAQRWNCRDSTDPYVGLIETESKGCLDKSIYPHGVMARRSPGGKAPRKQIGTPSTSRWLAGWQIQRFSYKFVTLIVSSTALVSLTVFTSDWGGLLWLTW